MTGDVIIRKQTINITASSEKLAFECRQFANESVNTDLVKMYERLFHQSTNSNQYVIIDSLNVDLGTLSIHDFKNHLFELLEDKMVNELRNQFETVSSGRGFNEPAGDGTDIEKETDPTIYTAEGQSRRSEFDGTVENEREIAGKPDPIVYSTEDRQYQEALFFFLRNGSFPWWYQKRSNKTPAEILKDFDKNSRTNLLIYLATKARNSKAELVIQIVKRLFCHLPQSVYESYLLELAALFSEDKIKANVQMLIPQKDGLEGLFQISVKEFYEQAMVFILLTTDKTDYVRKFLLHLNQTFPVKADKLKKWVAEIQTQKLLDVEGFLKNFDPGATSQRTEERSNLSNKSDNNLLEPSNKRNQNIPELNEGIYISNAGIVILHPFLTLFFKNLSLLDENNQFLSLDAQIKATVILNYLQTGQVDYNEWEMPLNKILCGMATDELIPNDILLNDQEKAESDSLLKTVIEYWGALKGASIEALQTTFLVREGKVAFKETHWLVQVERTGVDILLDRLPWGIGTIKLPWLKEIIYVEW